jgi:cell division protein FtsI (penicillin-binding protein 3)
MRIQDRLRRIDRWIAGTDDGVQGPVVKRMALVVSGIVGMMIGIVAQAATYQVTEQDTLAGRHAGMVSGRYTVTGRRGDILDATGQRLLAITVPDPKVVFRGAPAGISRSRMAYHLAESLSLDPDELKNRFLAAQEYLLIKEHLTREEVDAVLRQGLPGILIENDYNRMYPLHEIFGSSIGYLSVPTAQEVEAGTKGQFVARRGVERQYDAAMRPRSRSMDVMRDSGRRRFFQGAVGDDWDLDGADLVLNIDVQIQMALDEALLARVVSEEAVGAMGVVLDARTGAVLAMSSIPALDPNAFEEGCKAKDGDLDDGANPCRNKVIEFIFEPGSVGKLLTAYIGMDAGVFDAETRVDGHGGRCRVGRFEVRDVHGEDEMSVAEAFRHSSNCAFADLGWLIGPVRMREGLARLGIGARTGVDLPGEERGYLPPQDRFGLTLTKTTSYGYGYSASLLSLATIVATITGDGIRPVPRVAREIRPAGRGRAPQYTAVEGLRVASVEASRAMRKLMADAVMYVDPDRPRRRHPARPEGYSAGGKTGTTRWNLAGKGYSRTRYMCSFAGFAPAEDPEIVVAITVLDPQRHKLAAQVAGPAFKETVERILPLRGVLPELPEGGGNEVAMP